MIIFDYAGPKKRTEKKRKSAVRQWRDGLPVSDRANIDLKIKMLRDNDHELLPGLIAGPLSVKGKKFPHVYKLQVGGKVRLRPLLCRGPQDATRELTLLVGAKERDGKFEPPTAPETAVKRRGEVIADESYRQEYKFPA